MTSALADDPTAASAGRGAPYFAPAGTASVEGDATYSHVSQINILSIHPPVFSGTFTQRAPRQINASIDSQGVSALSGRAVMSLPPHMTHTHGRGQPTNDVIHDQLGVVKLRMTSYMTMWAWSNHK